MPEKAPPPDDAFEPDRTEAFEPDRTEAFEPDATQVGDADATRPLGQPDIEATQVAGADAWTGRAEVPDAVRGAVPPDETEQWTEMGPEEPNRRWWLPILLGLLGVLLVLAIIAAAMLIMRDDGTDVNPVPPTLAPSRSVAASLSPSAVPSPSPSPAAPSAATVLVPETQGDTRAQATGKLEALGLVVRVTYQEDPLAKPDTVLASVPTAGSVVPSGSQITLIVAKALPSPSPQPASKSPEPVETVGPSPS